MRVRLLAVLACALVALAPAAAEAAPKKSPRLTYRAAKRAITEKATRIAGESVEITALFRLGRSVYSGVAEWDRVDPDGCKGCGYDPATESFYDTPTTESCSVGMRAKKLRSGRIRVGTENMLCL